MEQSTKCAEIFHINGQLKYVCFLCTHFEETSLQFEEHFYSAHLKDLIVSSANIKKDNLFCQDNSTNNIQPSDDERHYFEIVEIKEELDVVDVEPELSAVENNKECIITAKYSKEKVSRILVATSQEKHDKIKNINDINIKSNIHDKDIKAESNVNTHTKNHLVKSTGSSVKVKVKKPRRKQTRKPSNKVYVCDICSKVCREFCNLKTHMRLHTGEKPFACNQCDRRFNENSSLTMHIRHHHTKDRPFQCTECGACFGFLRTLNAHIRVSHGIEKDILSPCPICAKLYKGNRNLKNHLRTHSIERPYSCTQCNKTFKQRKILSQHSKLHAETKSYSCPFCDLSFAQWAGRRGHIRRMHEGK